MKISSVRRKEIYGIIGYPIKHTLSPAMHKAAFGELGIDAQYRPFELEPVGLEGFLGGDIVVSDTKGQSISAKDIAGFNITIPHKVAAFRFFIKNKTVKPEAQVFIAGAVNTVKRSGSHLYCYNTDIDGFIMSLQQDLKFCAKGKTAFVFGSGGAGRAVVAGLASQEIDAKKIYLYDINKEATESAKRHFFSCRAHFEDINRLEFIPAGQIKEKINESDLLVNASFLGMKEGDGSLVDKGLLHKGLSVYDVVYNRKTRLVEDAQARGLRAINGLGMLLYQGVVSFEIWTGRRAPIDAMRKALTKC